MTDWKSIDPASREAIITALEGVSKCQVRVDDTPYDSSFTFMFTRRTCANDVRFTYEKWDICEMLRTGNVGPLLEAAKVMRERMNKQEAHFPSERIRGLKLDYVMIDEAEDLPEIPAKSKHSRVTMTPAPAKKTPRKSKPVPTEDVKYSKDATVTERFDVIKAVLTKINLDFASSHRNRHTCQIWATVKTLTGEKYQIVSDEDWVGEKLIYRAGEGELMTVMKSCGDEQGNGAGVEVMLTRNDLEDCFPDVYDMLAKNAADHGFKNYAHMVKEIGDLVGHRRQFGRALADMTDKAVVQAKAAAVQVHRDEKEGFYAGQEGFGEF